MKILITGAGGYIGSVATYLFLQKGYEIVAIDNFSTGYRQPLELLQDKFTKERFRYYERDLTEDLSDIFTKEQDISGVVHYASSCLVNESMEIPEKYFKGVPVILNILKHIRDFYVKNIIFSSTCAVYGEAQYMPVDELHPTNPVNPYGLAKRMVEEIIEWYGKIYGINYAILRYFNVCGASDDGLIGDSKKPSVLLIQNAVRGALGIEPFYLTCPTVETSDGTPIRDYINVVDLNLAHLLAFEHLQSGGSSEIINLGTGTGNSVMEIVSKVQEITGKKFDVAKSEPRKGEYATMIAKIDKASNILKWKPTHSITDSINSLVKWYTDRPNGWER